MFVPDSTIPMMVTIIPRGWILALPFSKFDAKQSRCGSARKSTSLVTSSQERKLCACTCTTNCCFLLASIFDTVNSHTLIIHVTFSRWDGEPGGCKTKTSASKRTHRVTKASVMSRWHILIMVAYSYHMESPPRLSFLHYQWICHHDEYYSNTKVTNHGSENKGYRVCRCTGCESMWKCLKVKKGCSQ